MNHLKALIMKFLMIAVVLLLILTVIYDVEIEKTLLISLALTLIAYVLGDLMIFRRAGDGASNKQSATRDSKNYVSNKHADARDPHEDHKKRNMMATIADILLSFFVIWVMGESMIKNPGEDIIQAALISALIIGVGEWFFHKYLDKNVFPEKNGHAVTNNSHH
ncbi:YndM family protein [Exiguobacterium acetylicum]|uniref:YndM family protein n=1 Tax=Exiguobacterium acetylicum TaxID=41170 RepID=UPI0027E03F2B|nr:YndM family protein [Exiguobacterium acetylicum]MDQ6466599.1 YndM family protein [Exiguobacterium acetylicum]